MTEFTAEQEAQSREFVKTAALAAVHINAVNEAVKLGVILMEVRGYWLWQSRRNTPEMGS
ncbi:hypothetical protein SEA_JADA_203 [Streptomyces phage Jada]|nr:hypothetical protein SEA_JADA_203 [Streptomyces phage Jada]